MSVLWMTLLLVTAGPVEPSTRALGNTTDSPRQGYELRDAVRSALRQWARPSDDRAPQAAREFLVLYQELQADSQLARSQKDTLRTQVRNRLAQLSEQISYRIAREKRLAKAERPRGVYAPPD